MGEAQPRGRDSHEGLGLSRQTELNPADLRGLLGVFGLEGVLEALPGYTDHNFKVTTPGGVYVLRIGRSSEERLGLRLAVAERLQGLEIATPVPVKTTDGRLYVRFDDGGHVTISTWVPGEAFAATGRPARLAREIGELAGDVTSLLAGLGHFAGGDARTWDLQYAAETISARMGSVRDRHRRRLLGAIVELIGEVDLGSLPRQVVHNDLNDDNVLISNGRVSGLIDFGDATWSLRIAEAAIAAAYVMLDQDDPVSVGAELLAGYAGRVDANLEEAAVVFDLILARLGTSVAISAAHSSEDPYRSRSEDLAWNLLERLSSGDRRAISYEMAIALGHELEVETPDLAGRRAKVMGPSLTLSYDRPLNIVRGRGVFLYDQRGSRFLDVVNNVAHVGHSRPEVVEAVASQAAILNTNTRYLHHESIRYCERLASTLPDPLEVIYLVNSGSEANELALRLARQATGRHEIACLEHGYHGNTTTLVDVSHYKFAGPGGAGAPDWVVVLPSPDPFRSPSFSGPDAADRYLESAERAFSGRRPAALICETLGGVAGQTTPEIDVVRALYDRAREAGALVIADEVQTGLGRVGEHFWAFQIYDVVPDIVTMGKPLGNGHPLGAVATTRAVADAFDNGMEYFNTFGGNPVSAAVGNAVLDVIEADSLQDNAEVVGAHLRRLLAAMAADEPRIGDERGRGLFVGVELVEPGGRESDAGLAGRVVEFARANGVLLSADGPRHNVLKMKPPMVFSRSNADTLVEVLAASLGEG